MRLQRLVPAALMIASLVLIARADDPPKPDAKTAPAKAEGVSKDEATIKQERLAAQFRDEGASADEVLQRLGGPPAAPEGSTVHDHDATPPPAGGRGNRRDRRPTGRPDARRRK